MSQSRPQIWELACSVIVCGASGTCVFPYLRRTAVHVGWEAEGVEREYINALLEAIQNKIES